MDSGSGGSYGIPQKRLHGHGHFVSDVVLSSDGHFALSGSWDKTLRLWDLSTGNTTRRFESHTKDAMSVAFSADNRQIVSGSRDKSIKLWTLWLNASIPFKKKVMVIGFPVLDSLPTTKTPSLFLAVRTNTSRYGLSKTAS